MGDNMVNINGSNDPYYRYKRHKISATQIRNNRTRIENVKEIGKDISRKPDEIMKALSLLLNTQVINTNCIKGHYMIDTLEKAFNKYVRDFVICNACTNPETTYLKKTVKLGKGCKACGHTARIKINPKLISYIIRQL